MEHDVTHESSLEAALAAKKYETPHRMFSDGYDVCVCFNFEHMLYPQASSFIITQYWLTVRCSPSRRFKFTWGYYALDRTLKAQSPITWSESFYSDDNKNFSRVLIYDMMKRDLICVKVREHLVNYNIKRTCNRMWRSNYSFAIVRLSRKRLTTIRNNSPWWPLHLKFQFLQG